MNINEMRAKALNELYEERVELLREQFNLRMQKSTGQLSKPHLLKQTRRNIARLNTLITEARANDAATK